METNVEIEYKKQLHIIVIELTTDFPRFVGHNTYCQVHLLYGSRSRQAKGKHH